MDGGSLFISSTSQAALFAGSAAARIAAAAAPASSLAAAPGRANNYGVPSNFPKTNPRTCQDVIDIEDLARKCAAGNGQVSDSQTSA